MPRIALVDLMGEASEWQCGSASYGPESVNVLLRDATSPDGTHAKFALIPLAGMAAVLEFEDEDG